MSTLNFKPIIAAAEKVLSVPAQPLSLHEPVFAGNEWKYVKDCLDTGWVSSVGAYVDRFEQMLAEITGAKRAVAIANGTMALHACLHVAGVKPGDEVLVPALTFIATANAVSYCQAVPHFVDSEERTLGLDPAKLRTYLRAQAEVRGGACFNKKTGARIHAVVPVHIFGHPVAMDELAEVCAEFHLELIEDAAESLGSSYKGRHTGNIGKLASLSFNGNKVVTTGGGGAILTNDAELGKFVKHLTTTAKVAHAWAFDHDQVGFNYRMPNLNAALGCAQLEELPGFIEKKRKLAEDYQRAFTGVEGVTVFREQAFARSNYWLNVILLNEPSLANRNKLLEELHRKNIMARPTWTLMHRLPMYKDCPRMDLSGAENLEARIVNLPSGAAIRSYA